MIYCKTFTHYGYLKSRFVKELDCKLQVSQSKNTSLTWTCSSTQKPLYRFYHLLNHTVWVKSTCFIYYSTTLKVSTSESIWFIWNATPLSYLVIFLQKASDVEVPNIGSSERLRKQPKKRKEYSWMHAVDCLLKQFLVGLQ